MNVLQVCFHTTGTRETFNTGICCGSGEGQDRMSGSTQKVSTGGESQGCLISVEPRLNLCLSHCWPLVLSIASCRLSQPYKTDNTHQLQDWAPASNPNCALRVWYRTQDHTHPQKSRQPDSWKRSGLGLWHMSNIWEAVLRRNTHHSLLLGWGAVKGASMFAIILELQ